MKFKRNKSTSSNCILFKENMIVLDCQILTGEQRPEEAEHDYREVFWKLKLRKKYKTMIEMNVASNE